MGRANSWEIVFRSKESGNLIRTQCDQYKNYKTMRKHIDLLNRYELVVLNPANDGEVIVPWYIARDCGICNDANMLS